VESLVQNAPLSKQRLWGARIISGVAVLFLLVSLADRALGRIGRSLG